MLGDGELIDFMAYPQLAYRCHTLYSGNRWAAIGFAGMFQDPYFSLGGDAISYGNDYIVDLVEKDLIVNVPQQLLDTAAAHYDTLMQRLYDRTKVWMDGAYAGMGSFNFLSARYVFELCVYYLDYVWGFMCNEHLESISVERKRLSEHFFMLEIILRDQILEAVHASLSNGAYYAKNVSGAFEGVSNFVSPFIFQLGQSDLWNWRFEMMLKIWLFTYLRITALKLGLEHFAERELVQDILTLPIILERHPFGAKDLDWLLAKLSDGLASRLETEFGVKPQLTISADHFNGARIMLGHCKDGSVPVDRSAKMQARANELWSRRRSYDQLSNQTKQLFKAIRGSRERLTNGSNEHSTSAP